MNHVEYFEGKKSELASIRENILTKSEFDIYISQLNCDMTKALPNLYHLDEPSVSPKISQEIIGLKNITDRATEVAETNEVPSQDTQQKLEEMKKKAKKRRFSFLRWLTS